MITRGLLALALLAAGPLSEDPEPRRQFDFWLGEWSVLNRHLQPDGSWRDGDVTRARITPVIDGAAVLEEWAGPLRGAHMNGFSLRAWDPGAERWALLLFWTTDGDGGFGRLDGRFRHGRGEFYSTSAGQGGAEVVQRYTFSDALPDTVRWDSAVSRDGRRTWRTDWIMEFTRTAPSSELAEARLFEEDWTPGELSPHEEARRLDWMLGEWRGTRVADGEERPARLRCKLLSRDCLVLDSLEVRGDDGWEKRLSVRGYVARRGAWESWRVSEADTRLRRSLGDPGEDAAVFEALDPETGALWRESLIRLGEDQLVIEVERRVAAGEELELEAVHEFVRRP